MKTLKTISAAFALTLLVSVVSAPAMDNGGDNAAPSLWTRAVNKAVDAKNWVADTTVVQGYLKPTKEFVVGADKQDAQKGLPVIKPVFDFLVRDYGRYTAAVTAVAVLGGAAYSYFTAEEATEELVGEPVQNTTVVDEETPVITEPTETPVVDAPKVVKPVRKPKIGARNMVKARRAHVATNEKAKRNTPAKRTAKSNAGNCKSGKCGVRRSK